MEFKTLFLVTLLSFVFSGCNVFNRGEDNVDLSIEGRFCGGIAANLDQNQCPSDYECILDNPEYPDSGGTCQKK